MASTGVRLGHGARVRIGRGVTPTWTTLTGVKDLTLPAIERSQVDVTSMDSLGFTEEFIPGLRVATEFSFDKDYVYGDAEDVLLSALVRAQNERVQLEILPPGGPTDPLVWLCFVSNYQPTLPVKEAMRATVTLRILAEIVD